MPLGLIYAALKLNGESGEIAEKIGKIIRDKNGVMTEVDRALLLKELGDVLWYLSDLAYSPRFRPRRSSRDEHRETSS